MSKSKNAAQADAVPGLLRRMNVRRVLDTLHLIGPATRAQLTRRTKISPPTMSKLIAQLVEAGLVERDAKPVFTRGRPGILFRPAVRNVQVLSAVIDVHHCTVLSTALDGDLSRGRLTTFKTPRRFDALIDELSDQLRDLRRKKDASALALGITVPGLINRQSGDVVFSPNMHFLDGRNPGRALSEKLKIETVTLQEEHALCLGEQMFGKAKGLTNFALIDVSEGFGMGVFNDGRFLFGHQGFGGEIGHITVEPGGRPCGCGNHGCLETIATDTAVAQALSEKLGRSADIDEIIDLVRQGSLPCDGELDKAIGYLSIGVAAVINIFNPEVVLIHGRMFDLSDNLMDRLQDGVRSRALKPSMDGCRIVRTVANKYLGAVAGTIQHIYSRMGPRM